MTIFFSLEHGNVAVSEDVIASIVGAATMECYGLVGMASQNKLKDGMTDLLKKENSAKGVTVQKNDENNLNIKIHLIVLYGVKISEVAKNIQAKVKHTLETMLGVSVDSIDIIVEGIRIEVDK